MITYKVGVSIPFTSDADALELGSELEDAVGFSGGSGAGMGYGDLDWYPNTEEESSTLYHAILQFFADRRIATAEEQDEGDTLVVQVFQDQWDEDEEL